MPRFPSGRGTHRSTARPDRRSPGRTAVASLGSEADAATEAVDAAITLERRLEHAYYAGMADLLGIEDRNERIARRELYRSCSRLGETVVDVAERVVYAVMKES